MRRASSPGTDALLASLPFLDVPPSKACRVSCCRQSYCKLPSAKGGQESKKFVITTRHSYGGKACDYEDGEHTHQECSSSPACPPPPAKTTTTTTPPPPTTTTPKPTTEEIKQKAWFCEQNVILGTETDQEDGSKSATAEYLKSFAEKITPTMKLGLVTDHTTAWGGGWTFGLQPLGFDAPRSFWPTGLSLDIVLANHCKGEYGCGGNARDKGSLMEDQKFAGILFQLDRPAGFEWIAKELYEVQDGYEPGAGPKADYPDPKASESTTGVGPCYAALKRDTKSECVKKILTFAKATRKEYLAHDVSRPTISYELCNCCHV